jgi:hypothetical protein
LEYYHGRSSETVFGLGLMSSNGCLYKTNTPKLGLAYYYNIPRNNNKITNEYKCEEQAIFEKKNNNKWIKY